MSGKKEGSPSPMSSGGDSRGNSMEPAEKKQRIHFGSLEEVERAKLSQKSSTNITPSSSSSLAPINVFTSEKRQTFSLTEQTQASLKAHNQILDEFERKKRAREIALPTDDKKVKALLREIGEPICLFGEMPHLRRERLRDLLSRMDEDERQNILKDEESSSESDDEEEFFVEGTKELKDCRMFITQFSLKNARDRISKQKQEEEQDRTEVIKKRMEHLSNAKGFTNTCSQIGDDRPLSCGSFSPDGSYFASGSWGGTLKLWTVPDCNNSLNWSGHKSRVGSVSFHPQSGKSLDPTSANVVSCAADSTVYLWSLKSTEPVSSLKGHTARVANARFHPSGKYIGTSSFDSSWRLWDIEKGVDLLLQEGHVGEIYSVTFQCDGSLAASCGQDTTTRVWDLRSGRQILVFEGHAQKVVTVDFSPNGYILASGSEDNTVRIWDLRKRKCSSTIPAHHNLVSEVKFQPTHGSYLVTGSFDNTAKIWSSSDWKSIKTLAGHENKVLGVDATEDGQYISTVSFDRTFKLWGKI